MRKLISTLLIAITAIFSANAALRFDGTRFNPVKIIPSAATGLEEVYVVNGVVGIEITYTAASQSTSVSVQTFGSRGAAYPEDVPSADIVRNGSDITVSNIKPDCGYAFTESGRTTYYWIADYSQHPYDVTSIRLSSDQECDRTFIEAEGKAPRMTYYSITGRAYEIDREISLSYTTLTADTDNFRYISAEISHSYPYIDGTFSVEAPLCDTYFRLSGDRFLREWGEEATTDPLQFTTRSVTAMTRATQTQRDSDNEVKSDEAIGGSAPVEVEFNAAASDAAIYTQWQMSTDPEFEDITYRTSELDFTYTFTQMGNLYVRFVAADASGACEYYGETYSVYIGESRLLCPNAFSPGASEGVNDEWKVSYKSIIDFDCYIFNRWGEKMAEFHDPAQGWDGKKDGKLVPAGVYYYVIKARGSDGKDYNLSGDINILRYQ